MSRRHSSGGVAANTAPMSSPAMVLCALVSCTTSLDLQSGRSVSPLSISTQRALRGLRPSSR
eukprot:8239420-Pyramimonas_sp.AAC.1